MGQGHTLPPTPPVIISTLCSIYQSEKLGILIKY